MRKTSSPIPIAKPITRYATAFHVRRRATGAKADVATATAALGIGPLHTDVARTGVDADHVRAERVVDDPLVDVRVAEAGVGLDRVRAARDEDRDVARAAVDLDVVRRRREPELDVAGAAVDRHRLRRQTIAADVALAELDRQGGRGRNRRGVARRAE